MRKRRQLVFRGYLGILLLGSLTAYTDEAGSPKITPPPPGATQQTSSQAQAHGDPLPVLIIGAGIENEERSKQHLLTNVVMFSSNTVSEEHFWNKQQQMDVPPKFMIPGPSGYYILTSKARSLPYIGRSRTNGPAGLWAVPRMPALAATGERKVADITKCGPTGYGGGRTLTLRGKVTDAPSFYQRWTLREENDVLRIEIEIKRHIGEM